MSLKSENYIFGNLFKYKAIKYAIGVILINEPLLWLYLLAILIC